MANNPTVAFPPEIETVEAHEVPTTAVQVAATSSVAATLENLDISQLNTTKGLAIMSLGQRLAYADMLIKTGLVPKHFNTPQKAVLAFEQGEALGLRPIEALSRLYVVDNKVCMYAELMRARATRAGFRFRRVETKADVIGPEYDQNGQPTGREVVVDWRWTMEMDEWINGKKEYTYRLSRTFSWANGEAGLMRNPVWKKHMDNMFFHRISTDLIRMHCPDVLLGCYEFSELADSSNGTMAYVLDENDNPVPVS